MKKGVYIVKKIISLILCGVLIICCFIGCEKTYNLNEYTKDEKYKPSFVNGFRHVYAYALSLVDKIEGVDIDWPEDFEFAERILESYYE